MVHCRSFKYLDGTLTIALDNAPQTLPPNKLTIILTRINSTQKMMHVMNASDDWTEALLHGNLDPGWYTIAVQASNNVGLARQFAHCEEHLHVEEDGMCGLIILYRVLSKSII